MRPFAIVVLAVVLTTACTGDDDGVAPSSAPPVTTTATSIATTVVTTVASTTGDPTTTPSIATDPTPATTTGTLDSIEPTPSTSTPIDPPPTTDPDIEQIRQEVAAALVASWEALDEFVRNPTSPEAGADLRSRMTEEEFNGVVDNFIVRYILNDLAERTNPDIPAAIVPYPETLQFDAATNTALMEFCFISTNLLVQVQEDGTEVLQDDRVGVVLGNDTFEMRSGVWVENGGATDEVVEGVTECPER